MRLTMVGRYPAAGHDPSGGVEVAVARLTRALSAAGVHVTIIAPGKRERYHDGDLDVRLTPEDARHGLVTSLRDWRSAVREILLETPTDVIHGQSLIACALAATDDRRPIPKFVTVHGNVLQDVLAHERGPRVLLRRTLVRRLATQAVTRADTVISVHPDWRLNLPVEAQRFVHIPNIVDADFFDVVRRVEAPRVLYCGGTRRVKGWDVLAAAWPSVASRHPEVQLELAGWPRDASTEPFGSERVETLETIDSQAVARAMSRASVLVIPSRFDLAPLVLAEAWAAGVPVVAAAVGGIPALADGAARLVPPESPLALAEAIGASLVEPEGAEVESGRARAQAYKADVVAAAHIALYENALAA